MNSDKSFEIIRRILSVSDQGVTRFIDLLLAETDAITKSKLGFLCRYHPDDDGLYYICDSGSKHIKTSKSDFLLVSEFPGPWHDAMRTNKIIVVNTPVSVKQPILGIAGTLTLNRLLTFPLTGLNGFKVCLVLADKDEEYENEDIQILESLIDPVKNVLSFLLKMEAFEKTTDEAVESNNRKILYLTSFIHEIKTPLNALAGFSQLLKEPGLKEENTKKYLDIITQTSDSMISLIKYFNEISEIETGKISIFETRVSLTAMLRDVYDLFRDESEKKNLVFVKEMLIPENESTIITDEVRLKQILIELLSNSFSFTYTGKIILRCELKGEFVEFCVSDTGIGISESQKNGVFNYSLSENSMVKNAKGSGLSMIISKSYAEMMGGRMWFNSEEGKGTDFHLAVPYRRVWMGEEELKRKEIEPIAPMNKRKVILVAEDDNLNFTLIRNFLSNLNVEILRAENGKEAVDIFAGTHIDLVLMDIRMPVMDGYTAAKLIKEINPSAKIIAQTAYSNDRSLAIKNGCDDFIAKPFGKQMFLSVVSSNM